MKTKPKYPLYLLIFLTLAVSMACGVTLGGGKTSPGKPAATQDAGGPATGVSSEKAVSITESEFQVTIEPQPVEAGEVTFVVRNEGHAPHDFRLATSKSWRRIGVQSTTGASTRQR